MQVREFIKNNKKFTFLVLKIFVIILFLVLFAKAYTYFHELSHATACELQGYESSVDWKATKTNCPKINEAGTTGRFFYYMAPYFSCFAIILLFALSKFHEKYPPLIFIPTAPIFDMFINFVFSPININTDFSKLWAIEGDLVIPAFYVLFLSSITLIYWYKIFIPSRKKVSNYFRDFLMKR